MADEDGKEMLAVAEPASSSGARGRRAEIESSQSQKLLDTPRTREACRRLGLVLEDLHFKSFDGFYLPGDLKEKQQLRFEHYEKRRKERLAQVLAERAKVIASAAKKGDVPGVQSGQFLCMLESLFEKEAKRLESDLKGQLRQHGALVKENEDQLDKEAKLQEKLALRDAQRNKAEKYHKDIGETTREKREKSANKSAEIIAAQKDDLLAKQASKAKELLAEEERMERFHEERMRTTGEKAKVFRERVQGMKAKTAELTIQKRMEGEAKLRELEAKVENVHQRREAELQSREVRSEEQHLHIMDVRDKKGRLDRVDGARREELRGQIDSNVERIETLLALKDQLLDQRKGRNLKQAAMHGSRGLSLKKDCLPGPGAYEAAVSCMAENPAPKMSKSNAPGMLDQVVAVTAKNPAPGSYDANVLPNGDKISGGNAVKFGERNRDSFLDDAMKAKDFLPAPGRYEIKNTLDHRAPKMRRDRLSDPGNDKYSVKQYPVWARPGTQTPGPAGYSVDDFARKEVLRRVTKSLPNLTKDMLRPGPAAA